MTTPRTTTDRAVFADVGANDAEESIGGLDNETAAPMGPSMICTCVLAIGSKVCFATYNEEQNKIIMEESPSGGYDIEAVAERYLSLVRPNLLLVNSGIASNEDFLQALTKQLPEASMGSNNNESDAVNDSGESPARSTGQRQEGGRSVPYRLLRSGAWDQTKCLAIILDKLRVLSAIRRGANTGRMLRVDEPRRIFPMSGNPTFGVSNYNSIGTLIDLDSPLQIRCLGALLSFLESTIFSLEIGGTITVNDIEHAKSSKFMNINSNTISALNIFSTEHHPLVVSSGKGNSKEGSSLFSLLDRTRSRGGREMLRSWMLQPLLEPDEIRLRQDGVELFCSQIDSDGQTGAILVLLQDIGPIYQILNRLKKCATLPMDFITTARTLAAAVEVCRILEVDILQRLKWMANGEQLQAATGAASASVGERRNKAERYVQFLEKILERCDVPTLQKLYKRITDTIDEDSTAEARDTVFIRSGFDEKLDDIKKRYGGLDGKKGRPYATEWN